MQGHVFRGGVRGDAGADMVMGGHTHSVQRTEWYNNRMIVYSLGNFIFDQLFSEDVKRGLVVTTDLFLPIDQDALKDIDLFADCAKFKDECWQRSIFLDYPKLEYKASFSAQVSENRNRQTHKATQKVRNQILQQASWNKTMKQINKKK